MEMPDDRLAFGSTVPVLTMGGGRPTVDRSEGGGSASLF